MSKEDKIKEDIKKEINTLNKNVKEIIKKHDKDFETIQINLNIEIDYNDTKED